MTLGAINSMTQIYSDQPFKPMALELTSQQKKTLWKIANFVAYLAAAVLGVGGGLVGYQGILISSTPIGVLQISAGVLMLLAGLPLLIMIALKCQKRYEKYAKIP